MRKQTYELKMLYEKHFKDDAIFDAQNGIKFLLFNARSIQNKHQDISNLLQQLDSEAIVIVLKLG